MSLKIQKISGKKSRKSQRQKAGRKMPWLRKQARCGGGVNRWKNELY
jgi:hypothetical protein